MTLTGRMTTGCAVALVCLLLGPAKVAAQKACTFDTVGHTDQLTLDIAVRVYRGKDSLPDPLLTATMGDLLRGHIALPPTFGGLLYPNTYFANTPPVFTSSFGSIQFEMTPQGKTDKVKWYAVSLDKATDDAFEAALRQAFATEDFKFFAGSAGGSAPQLIRVQLLVTQDTIVHSPLARMKVPMIRVDTRPMPGRVLIPADQIRSMANEPAVAFELTIDAQGKPVRSSIQIVEAPSPSATATALQMMLARDYQPARVSGCPVAMRMGVRTH